VRWRYYRYPGVAVIAYDDSELRWEWARPGGVWGIERQRRIVRLG
jgi:hypothetical protein